MFSIWRAVCASAIPPAQRRINVNILFTTCCVSYNFKLGKIPVTCILTPGAAIVPYVKYFQIGVYGCIKMKVGRMKSLTSQIVVAPFLIKVGISGEPILSLNESNVLFEKKTKHLIVTCNTCLFIWISILLPALPLGR